MLLARRIILSFTLTCLISVSQFAFARHAAILVDADTGNVLYEKEANQAWYPASLTKLMTLYMTFSALNSGRLHLSDQLYVSPHAARQPTSKLGLRTYETISVEDAIIAIITRSANDASVVLAEEISGSERQFAVRMTSTAHSLGMYGSHFMNATGLPHDWQTTTAHDMAVLALRTIRDFPRFYYYFRVDSLYFHGRELHGINKFTSYYPGAEGMKTGYTCGSGYNLVASANQYGKRLIGVVLGGMTSNERYDHMYTMMDAGFSNRFGSYGLHNINSMNKNSIGVPPYQLTCGHRPKSHYAASHFEESDDDYRHSRYVKKSPKVTHVSTHDRVKDNVRVTKSSLSSRTEAKSVITKKSSRKDYKADQRSTQSTPALAKADKKSDRKTSRKTDKQDSKTSATKSKSKSAGASSKNTKDSAKKSTASTSTKTSKVSAKTSSSGKKGYYVPAKTESTKSSSKKGYYKPTSYSKSDAKSSSSAKRKTKK
jgi:D-alanyl-D-alanine carboxypeptidase